MALSIDAIYKPINEFFLEKFGSREGAPVQFRFARTPRTFVDSDFLVATHPEWGPWPALAQEICSVTVDGIVLLEEDGRTASLGPQSFTDKYHDEMLSPAQPYAAPGSESDLNFPALLEAFGAVKNQAKQRWESMKAAPIRAGAAGDEIRLCIPDHANWWHRDDETIWIPKSFDVKDAGGSPEDPRAKLLKMRPDEERLRVILDNDVLSTEPAPRNPVLIKRRVGVSAPTRAMFSSLAGSVDANLASRAPMAVAPAMIMAQMTSVLSRTGTMVAQVPQQTTASPAINQAALAFAYRKRLNTLPFQQRFEVEAVVRQASPTAAVASQEVTISFDYCLVNVERPWLHYAFLENRTWFIPGLTKGQLSTNDGHGVPALAVGFVAIRNLRVKAPWTPTDITNLNQSDQFGPFCIGSDVVNGAVGHDGIQIVGWMLQDLPDLPPNG